MVFKENAYCEINPSDKEHPIVCMLSDGEEPSYKPNEETIMGERLRVESNNVNAGVNQFGRTYLAIKSRMNEELSASKDMDSERIIISPVEK